MPEEPKVPQPSTAEVAKVALLKMSEEERNEIWGLVQHALSEHDLPRFKAGLLKLGFDENSVQYEKMMQLWDEHTRASRHG
jgi:hypothetical protein